MQGLFNIAVLLVNTLIVLHLCKGLLTAFAFISGAAAVGVGFDGQNGMNSVIRGWIVILERPHPNK